MKLIQGLPTEEPKKGQLVAMDVEMFKMEKGKLHRPTGTFACLSICFDKKNVYQIYDQHDVKKALQIVKNGTWVFQNALFDLRQLQRYAEIKPRFIWDTMLVDQSMYGGYYNTFSLGDLSRRYLSEYMEKEVRQDFIEATEMTPDMKKYAAKDAFKTVAIAGLQQEYIGNPAFGAYTKIDEPMIWPILDMPGMCVDVGAWTNAVTGFTQTGKELEEKLGFNVKSVPQVHAALGKIGLHLEGTGQEILSAFKDTHPLVAAILEARLYRDAASKYGIKWLEAHVEADGRVYPSYHITGAETGRMSSSEPNGQNIPQRKLPIYRTFFVASDGNVMMVSDAAAQEPCILAYESHDEALMKALKSGVSVHMAVARDIFGDPKINSKEDDRYKAGKAINLGMSYGLSEYGLAKRLNITEQQAAQFISQYFSKFPDILNYINMKRQEAFGNGFITTSSGRRVYINTHTKGWQNNAINSPIQGGAADQMKRWVRLYWEGCRSGRLPYCLNGIIHDEQTKDVPKSLRKETKEISDKAFLQSAEELFPLMPFRVETEVGRSWAAKQLPEEIIDDE